MKRQLIHLFSLVLCVLCSCNNEANKSDKPSVVIGVLTDEDKKINISDFVDRIDYIYLEETKNNILGGIDKIVLFNKNYYLSDSKTKTISVYSEDGKFIFKVDRFGRGPGEYMVLNDFLVNKSDSTLEVWDNGRSKIIRYNKAGKFLAEASLDIRMESFVRTKEDFLLCYTCNYPNYNFNGIKTPYNIYLLNYEGAVLDKWLPINANNLKLLNTNMFSEYANGVNVAIPFDNNIYHIDNRNLNISYKIEFENYSLPDDILDEYSKVDTEDNKARSNASIKLMNTINSSNYAISIHNVFENSKYLFFQYNITRLGIYTVLYDKNMDYVRVGVPENDVDNGLFGRPVWMDENYLYAYVYPYELLKHLDQGGFEKLPQSLLLESLKGQSNPILIKMHLK